MALLPIRSVYFIRMTVVTKSLSDEINTLNTVLSKDINSLTTEDVELLERYNSIAEKLTADNVKGIDVKAIEEKLVNYKAIADKPNSDQNNENTEKPEINENPSVVKIGCGGSVVGSLFGVLTLVGTTLVLKKKRRKF